MNKKLAPSLLAANFANLERDIRAVEAAGADFLHLDVMDGRFVPNISFGPPVIAAIRSLTKLPFDTHLMIEEPDRYLEDYRAAGADIITVHQEVCRHLHRTVAKIKELGAKAGVAVNPATALDALLDIIDEVDLVLVMSVNPGFGGQTFVPASIEKIERVSQMTKDRGRDILIEVDGGIDASNIHTVSAAGANVFVAGTSVFRQQSIASAMTLLRSSLAQ